MLRKEGGIKNKKIGWSPPRVPHIQSAPHFDFSKDLLSAVRSASSTSVRSSENHNAVVVLLSQREARECVYKIKPSFYFFWDKKIDSY